MRTNLFRLFTAALLGVPAFAHAQGTLSTQGFGYPTGYLSTRTLGTGGALAEIDPLSASNPASILNIGGSALYIQLEPEFRTLSAGSASEKTTIARYPLAVATIPITQTVMAGISVTNLLDRSFQTVSRGSQVVGGTTLTSTNVFVSDGAIGDIRLSLAWAPTSWLHLGAAGHVITGDNRLSDSTHFDDSTRYAPAVDSSTVTYVGNAFSAGVEVYTGRYGVVAASYRRGGTLSLKGGDATIGKANVPDRLALSAAYLGIRGTSIAVRAAHDTWSNMRGLGSATVPITDSWDTSVGADVLGPRFLGSSLQLRAGGRWRTLPFGVPSGGEVTEKSFMFGTGSLLARGRAAIDLAGIRSTRSSSV
ncbi:MAG: hypothetical protein ACJ8AD_19060, partial [Gemmatimonadaceae bacterium]